MTLVKDENRIWNATIKIGGADFKLELFDAFDTSLVFKEEFMNKLKHLIIEHEHYMAGDVLTEITSPEGEDFSKYAVFVLLIQLDRELHEEYGDEHMYLFALRKDGYVQLAGVDSKDMDEDDLLNILSLAFEEPAKVESLILAYTPE